MVKRLRQNTLRSLFLAFYSLWITATAQGTRPGTVGVVDIVVARRGNKLLIRVERELTFEVRARLADGRGKAARLALLAAVHIGRDDDRAATAADAVELGKGLVRLVEQVDDIRGDDHVELPVRLV